MSGSTQEPGAYVRLTEAAFDDLRTLNSHDPQIVRWVFKKMLLLERDPPAGAPLLGEVIGYRKRPSRACPSPLERWQGPQRQRNRS